MLNLKKLIASIAAITVALSTVSFAATIQTLQKTVLTMKQLNH